MKKWDGIEPQPCWSWFGNTHLLVASEGGWSFLCIEKPERWQTMEGHPTDDPLIIPNSEKPTCEVCLLILNKNDETNLTNDNWPVSWRRVPL